MSCGASKADKLEATQMAAAPQWAKQRPLNNMYFIGIAKINKTSYSNYTESAKKMALNDLASEISVVIESNTIVSSSENNNNFETDFSRYIKMEMRKDLEGYTLKGEYETSRMYMVYYQLSKQKWKQIQAKRKSAAADRAFTLLMQSQTEISNLQYSAAIKTLTNSLLEIKNYWNEPVFHSIEGGQMRLDTEIRTQLSGILSEVKLVVDNESIILNTKNDFQSKLSFKAANHKGLPLEGFPITISYRKATLPYQSTIYSEKTPSIISLDKIKFSKTTSYIKLQLEKDKVIHIKSEDRKMLKFINDAFQTNPINIAVNFELPKIYIKVLKATSNSHYLKDAISQSISEKGFVIVSDRKNSDLVMEVIAHENINNQSSKIQISYVSFSASLKQKKNNETIYSISSEKHKGADYKISVATEKSYIKMADEIRNNSFNDLLNAVLY